jgi:hypothetical protein
LSPFGVFAVKFIRPVLGDVHIISFTLFVPERVQLEAVAAGRITLQKHVCRARIELPGFDRLGMHAIMRNASVSQTVVWRPKDRAAQERVKKTLSGQIVAKAIFARGTGDHAVCGRSDERQSARRDHVF